MESYDANAWQQINQRRAQVNSSRARNLVPRGAREAGTRIVSRGKDAFHEMPGSEQVQHSLNQALLGLTQAVGTTAAASVSRRAVLARYRRRGHQLARIEDIQGLSLETSDAVYPRRKRLVYMSASAAQGGAAGAAITVSETGAVVGGVFGAGAGAVPGVLTVVSVLAADAAGTLAAATRIAAETSALYGYDPNDPREELFLAGLIGVATAGSQAAKMAADRELHQLAYALARNATWDTLNRNQVTKVVAKVWPRLGQRLTRQQLGRITPALGIVIGAGVNANLMRRVADEAYFGYRERRLRERYGEPPDGVSIVGLAPDADSAGGAAEPLIIDLLDEPEADALELGDAPDERDTPGRDESSA